MRALELAPTALPASPQEKRPPKKALPAVEVAAVTAWEMNPLLPATPLVATALVSALVLHFLVTQVRANDGQLFTTPALCHVLLS